MFCTVAYRDRDKLNTKTNSMTRKPTPCKQLYYGPSEHVEIARRQYKMDIQQAIFLMTLFQINVSEGLPDCLCMFILINFQSLGERVVSVLECWKTNSQLP